MGNGASVVDWLELLTTAKTLPTSDTPNITLLTILVVPNFVEGWEGSHRLCHHRIFWGVWCGHVICKEGG
jgi:hypothetical protein